MNTGETGGMLLSDRIMYDARIASWYWADGVNLQMRRFSEKEVSYFSFNCTLPSFWKSGIFLSAIVTIRDLPISVLYWKDRDRHSAPQGTSQTESGTGLFPWPASQGTLLKGEVHQCTQMSSCRGQHLLCSFPIPAFLIVWINLSFYN